MERFSKLMESIPPAMDGIQPIVVSWSIPLAFCIAVGVGVLFGITARKADGSNPSTPACYSRGSRILTVVTCVVLEL